MTDKTNMPEKVFLNPDVFKAPITIGPHKYTEYTRSDIVTAKLKVAAEMARALEFIISDAKYAGTTRHLPINTAQEALQRYKESCNG